MRHGNKKQTDHDAFTLGLGQDRPASGQHGPAALQLEVLQEGLYPSPTAGHSRAATILQDRLPGHPPVPVRLDRRPPGAAAQEGIALLHALLRPQAPPPRGACQRLLAALFAHAKTQALSEAKATAIIAATGLESRPVSAYFVDRKGYRRFPRRRWPKLTLVCHASTHLFAAAVITQGPSQDSPQFPAALRQ